MRNYNADKEDQVPKVATKKRTLPSGQPHDQQDEDVMSDTAANQMPASKKLRENFDDEEIDINEDDLIIDIQKK